MKSPRRPAPAEPVSQALDPHSIQSEQGVLGAMLISKSACDAAGAMLTAGDFYHTGHRKLFAALAEMHGRGETPDIYTATEELRRRDELEGLGGSDYIATLAAGVPTAAHIEHYAGRVLRTANLRRLIRAGRDITQLARDAEDDTAALADAERTIQTLRERRPPPRLPVMSAPELVALQLDATRWAVPGLIPEGLTILVSPPKIGKSWMALQLGLAVASGGVALGSIQVEQGEALCLMLEDTKRRAQRRLVQLLGETEAPAGMHLALDWARMDEGGAATLEQYLAAHPATRLVIIDTLERFRQGRSRDGQIYSDDYAALAGIKRIADHHGCAILVLHHTRKADSASDAFDSVSGTQAITGAADGTLLLKRSRNQGGATLDVTGRDIDEQQFALTFDRVTAWTLRGEAAQYERTQEEHQVLEALEAFGRPAQPHEIAEWLGIKRPTARQRCYRMAERGILIASHDGYYAPSPRACAEKNAQIGVTPVNAVTRHTVTRDGGDVGDAGDERDRCDTETTIFDLALTAGFPGVDLGDGGRILAGEDAWRSFCATVSEELLDLAGAALVRAAAEAAAVIELPDEARP